MHILSHALLHLLRNAIYGEPWTAPYILAGYANVESKSNTFSSPVARIMTDTPIAKDRFTREKNKFI